MRSLMLGIALLFAVLAVLVSLPGPILAQAELADGRNPVWGTVLLISHAAAAICALVWGGSILIRGKPGPGGWIAGYLTSYVIGLMALGQMKINFMT